MGGNEYGQLGLGAADADAHPTAAQLAALGSGVVQVAAGYSFSAALTAGGEVYLWGSNALGQLANGECSPCGSSCSWDSSYCYCDACLGQDVAAPARVAALGTDTVQLALGHMHALALKQGGAVLSWGRGNAGQLGLGDPAPTRRRAQRCESDRGRRLGARRPRRRRGLRGARRWRASPGAP